MSRPVSSRPTHSRCAYKALMWLVVSAKQRTHIGPCSGHCYGPAPGVFSRCICGDRPSRRRCATNMPWIGDAIPPRNAAADGSPPPGQDLSDAFYPPKSLLMSIRRLRSPSTSYFRSRNICWPSAFLHRMSIQRPKSLLMVRSGASEAPPEA